MHENTTRQVDEYSYRRVVGLEMALEPEDKCRFPGPPSTPTQVTLVEIMNAIRTREAKIDHFTETLDEYD